MGIKKNVLYTSFLTTSNYIFPLLVYPYVSRVLGVTNIGLCNFIDNIINYFILISMMGINIMGNRQIASDRANHLSLDKSFSSLISLNAITTFIALGVLIGCIYIIPELHENQDLMWYGAIKLVSNFMLIEWFYKGIEDFKYITVRTIIVKCLYVVAIYLFVNRREDYATYFLLTVLMVTVNALINFYHSHRFARFNYHLIRFSGILKPFLLLGVYMLVTSFCTSFNVVFLGFTTDDTQVGYYTTAIKLYSILLAFFTGFTSVMLPRMSNLIASGKRDEFHSLLQKSISLLFDFAIPLIILTVIFSPQIIMLISGPGYEGAITPMRIILPLMLIIGYEQITVIQGLMPLRADKIIMINASAGAIVSLILNLTLVASLKSVGSAIACIASEFTILVLSQIAIRKLTGIKFQFGKLFKVMCANIPLAIILTALYFFMNEEFYWGILITAATITMLYTLIIQMWVFRNPFLSGLINKLKQI